MTRLSSPISSLQSRYDIIVIGSGYGGSITASRMARAGKKVCLLERGKEIQPKEYPNEPLQGAKETQLDTPDGHIGNKTGMFDVRVNHDVNVVLGCGLGGGSLINANVGMKADKDVMADPVWPLALREDTVHLDKAFAEVQRMLRTTPYPASRPMPAKSYSMRSAAEGMDLPDTWAYTPIYVNFDIDGPNHVGVEQHPCVGCGDCCSGCNYSAKNTMIMNYLPDARNHGAEIYTQVNVRWIEKAGEEWKVYYNLFTTGDEAFDAPTDTITASIVLLAAGTLGSTELLLRSASHGLSCSDAAGQHFSANGDFLAFSYNDELRANTVGNGTQPPDPEDPVGPNISSIIDLRGAGNANSAIPATNAGIPPPKMVIEDGVAPGLMGGPFAAMVSLAADLEGVDTSKTLADKIRKTERAAVSLLRGPYHGAVNHTLTYLVMTDDNDKGQMLLEKDRLRIDWPGAGKLPIYEQVSERLLKATQALDGVYTRNPAWTPLFHESLVTVHPLGGCIMAEDAAHGVVNHKGQVFSAAAGTTVHEGLYISDGSIIPRPLCINPSLTISALAERNCMYMASDRGWSFDYILTGPQPAPIPQPEYIPPISPNASA